MVESDQVIRKLKGGSKMFKEPCNLFGGRDFQKSRTSPFVQKRPTSGLSSLVLRFVWRFVRVLKEDPTLRDSRSFCVFGYLAILAAFRCNRLGITFFNEVGLAGVSR